MTEEVKVNVHAAWTLHGGNPHPVAFLWVGSNIHDFYPCGRPIRRISWLPLWVPFNCRMDYSLQSQIECVEVLRKYGEKLVTAKGGTR